MSCSTRNSAITFIYLFTNLKFHSKTLPGIICCTSSKIHSCFDFIHSPKLGFHLTRTKLPLGLQSTQTCIRRKQHVPANFGCYCARGSTNIASQRRRNFLHFFLPNFLATAGSVSVSQTYQTCKTMFNKDSYTSQAVLNSLLRGAWSITFSLPLDPPQANQKGLSCENDTEKIAPWNKQVY